MKIIHVTSSRREEWNAFASREQSFALLQSWEWGEFKEKMGWKAFRIALEERGLFIAGAQMLVKSLPLGLASVAYIPRGPIGNWVNDDVSPRLFNELHQIAKNNRAIFLKIEPSLLYNPDDEKYLQRFQFISNPYTNQPRATIIIDLSNELDAIMAQFHHKTRYNIRLAERKGVTVHVGNREHLPILERLTKILKYRAGFSPRKLKYYEHEWETFDPLERIKLFVAFYQGEPLAVNVSALFGEHAAYIHGASSNEHRNLMPNHILMWEAIKWAKQHNCRTFDLWGIPEEVGMEVFDGKDLPASTHTDGLWGVYRFKSGFSKNVLLYMKAHDFAYAPFLYKLYSNNLFNSDRLDRIIVWMDAFKSKFSK